MYAPTFFLHTLEYKTTIIVEQEAWWCPGTFFYFASFCIDNISMHFYTEQAAEQTLQFFAVCRVTRRASNIPFVPSINSWNVTTIFPSSFSFPSRLISVTSWNSIKGISYHTMHTAISPSHAPKLSMPPVYGWLQVHFCFLQAIKNWKQGKAWEWG